MPFDLVLILLLVTAVVALSLGYFIRWLLTLGRSGTLEMEIKERLLSAEQEAKNIVAEAQKRSDELLQVTREEVREKEDSLKKTEKRLIKKEELLDQRQIDIDSETDYLKDRVQEVKAIKNELKELKEKYVEEIQKAARLSQTDARELLLEKVKAENSEDIQIRIAKLEKEGFERFENRAREILATVIHRLGNQLESDVLSSTVSLPSDDVKGKIIGKEGRNIKTFERETGVEVFVDDTPETVTLSSYDPVRREIARRALERLIADGRIQPARIEEEVASAREEVKRVMREQGEAACFECGIFSLDDRIVGILGRLHFRTSYGQNVLRHSIEVSHLAGMLAEELGGNVHVAKTAGLLHDIGKAVDHEISGSHVEIGIRILKKFGVNDAVIDAMKAHHEEYPYESIESYLVQVADSISASRPGARRDNLENYLKRISELEEIANTMPGVDKSYAIAAGRELRVFVNAEEISDLEARDLARTLVKKIEEELRFPGEIKVNVIREKRIIEYAR